MSAFRIVIAPLCALLVLVAGCESKEAIRDRSLKEAANYVAQGKLPEAIIAYRQAIQADPQNGPARLKLADLLIQTDKAGQALEQYVRAADLLPDDVDAQVVAGQMLLIAKRYEDAQARAQKALDKSPRNADALILKGNAMAGLKNLDGALMEYEDAIRAEPSKGLAYANLGALQYARGDTSRSEAAFKAAIAAVTLGSSA